MTERLHLSESEGAFRLPPFPQLVSAVGLTMRTLGGGLNHNVFAVETDGQVYCVKIYTDSARDQAAREWWALKTMEGSGLAPTPLAYLPTHECAPFGAVLMEYVEGRLVTSFPDAQRLVSSLFIPAITTVHNTQLDARSIPWAAEGDPTGCFDDWAASAISKYSRAREAVAQSLGEKEDELLDALVDKLRDFVGKVGDVQPVYTLCKGDPNLANVMVQSDGRLRLLDWEYCGYGDAAYEFADHLHHPACEVIPRTVWLEAADVYAQALDDTDFVNRLRIYDILMGAWWCLRLARGILEASGGIERRPQKADPELQAANRMRLKDRVERAVSRLSKGK